MIHSQPLNPRRKAKKVARKVKKINHHKKEDSVPWRFCRWKMLKLKRKPNHKQGLSCISKISKGVSMTSWPRTRPLEMATNPQSPLEDSTLTERTSTLLSIVAMTTSWLDKRSSQKKRRTSLRGPLRQSSSRTSPHPKRPRRDSAQRNATLLWVWARQDRTNLWICSAQSYTLKTNLQRQKTKH